MEAVMEAEATGSTAEGLFILLSYTASRATVSYALYSNHQARKDCTGLPTGQPGILIIQGPFPNDCSLCETIQLVSTPHIFNKLAQ